MKRMTRAQELAAAKAKIARLEAELRESKNGHLYNHIRRKDSMLATLQMQNDQLVERLRTLTIGA